MSRAIQVWGADEAPKRGNNRGKYAKNPKSLNKRLVIMVDSEAELFVKEHGELVRGEVRKLIESLRDLRLNQGSLP